MANSMLKTFNEIKANSNVPTEGHHLFDEGYIPCSVVTDFCRVYDQFQIAQKTGEPFMSVVEKIGCFGEKDVEGLSLPKFYDPRHKLVVQQITMQLGKTLLTGPNAPTSEELSSLMKTSVTVPNEFLYGTLTYKTELNAIASYDQDVERVLSTLKETVGETNPEFVETIEGGLNSTVETMAPYTCQAALTIQTIKDEEDKMRLALQEKTMGLVDGFNHFSPVEESAQ